MLNFEIKLSFSAAAFMGFSAVGPIFRRGQTAKREIAYQHLFITTSYFSWRIIDQKSREEVLLRLTIAEDGTLVSIETLKTFSEEATETAHQLAKKWSAACAKKFQACEIQPWIGDSFSLSWL